MKNQNVYKNEQIGTNLDPNKENVDQCVNNLILDGSNLDQNKMRKRPKMQWIKSKQKEIDKKVTKQTKMV